MCSNDNEVERMVSCRTMPSAGVWFKLAYCFEQGKLTCQGTCRRYQTVSRRRFGYRLRTSVFSLISTSIKTTSNICTWRSNGRWWKCPFDCVCLWDGADNLQDKNTPAVVSLVAGGIAGGVEGFLSVRQAIVALLIILLTPTLVSPGVCED
jgi:hypothetical protein